MKLRNVIFYVFNIEKSKEFYKKLGFKVAQDFGKFVSYKTDVENCSFAIMGSQDSSQVPGKQVCGFWTNSIEKEYKKMQDMKVEIATELYEAPFGRTFAIRDPDGNKIEYIEAR